MELSICEVRETSNFVEVFAGSSNVILLKSSTCYALNLQSHHFTCIKQLKAIEICIPYFCLWLEYDQKIIHTIAFTNNFPMKKKHIIVTCHPCLIVICSCHIEFLEIFSEICRFIEVVWLIWFMLTMKMICTNMVRVSLLACQYVILWVHLILQLQLRCLWKCPADNLFHLLTHY